MVRSIVATTAALITVAFTAAAAQAAPLSPAGTLAAGTSQLIAVGGHQVCLKSQCPGRSRVVCGCPKSSR
jgi:hypothetical protein